MNNTSFNYTTASHTASELSWTSILKAIILYTIVVVTISGNILVLVAVYINKKLQTTFNCYVVNLAVTDLAVAVTAMSFHTTDSALGYWPFGEFLCGVWIFFDYGMTFVSVFTLILISIDRFWSVTWSIHYRHYHSKRKCVIAIISMWVFMLVLWLPPCIIDRLNNAKPGECIWEPSLNIGFVVVVAVIGHHGSCLVMLFCYIKVFIFMHKRGRVVASEGGATVNKLEVSVLETELDKTSNAVHSKQCGTNTLCTFVASEASQETPSCQEACSSQDCQSQPIARYDVQELPIPKLANKPIDAVGANPQPSKQQRLKRDRAIFVTLSYVVIGYAVCWIPFHIAFDISAICPSCLPHLVYDITFWMAYFNSAINPFLYNFSTPEFRKTFRKLLLRK